MKTQLVHCFCIEGKIKGNAAAVIRQFAEDDDAKQALARKLKLPVTVFLTETDKQFPLLEFFYPEVEMPLYIHGTLAAAMVLFSSQENNNTNCVTKSGQLLILRKNADDLIQIKVSQQSSPHIIVNKAEVSAMLGLSDEQFIVDNLPFVILSVGSPKLIIPVTSFNILASLQPNFEKIKEWSINNRVNGFYVYTNNLPAHLNYDFYARNFNPKTGYHEDAATGVAAVLLSLFFAKDLKIGQGMFIDNPCEIIVSYESPESIWVGGKTYFESLENCNACHSRNRLSRERE